MKFLRKTTFARYGMPSLIISDQGTHFDNKSFDALWAYCTAFKTLLGMSLYKEVYGGSCHPPVELEHQAWWVIRILNLDLNAASEERRLRVNELKEIRRETYDNT